MVDIQTDPIKHQNVKKLRKTNISNISVFDSKFRIGFEIPTPASPSCYIFPWLVDLSFLVKKLNYDLNKWMVDLNSNVLQNKMFKIYSYMTIINCQKDCEEVYGGFLLQQGVDNYPT